MLRKPKPRYKKLRRKDYHPQEAGDLVQIDSIVIFLNGIKRYILTAIGLVTEFAFAYCYSSLSSKNTEDFMRKLTEVTPFGIKRIQTDNGAEFEKHFRDYIQKQNLVQFHNYPGHPQSNARVERFNRTLQEQYTSWHLDELHEPREFNKVLIEYLIWYNTRKPHRTLDKIPPLRYYLDNYIQDLRESNMLWTLTLY